jgi:hypothetical protein
VSLGETEHYERHTVSARLTHDLGRGLNAHAGYGYSDARYRQDDRYVNHNIDLGVDYNRSLSFSGRRTTLSFGTGTSASRSGSVERRGSFRFRATGSAQLSHEIGRTWDASLAYDRGLRFSETWTEPLFTDTVTARVGGLVNRRSQIHVTARALRGNGYSGGGAKSYSAVAGLTVAITRYVNTGLTYMYYQHQFASELSLAAGFPRSYEGQSIRASVTVWAPLFQRERRP